METTEGIRKLKVCFRVWFRFILFYTELAHTDLWCNMLQTLLGRKKCEGALSDKKPLRFRFFYSVKFGTTHKPLKVATEKFFSPVCIL